MNQRCVMFLCGLALGVATGCHTGSAGAGPDAASSPTLQPDAGAKPLDAGAQSDTDRDAMLTLADASLEQAQLCARHSDCTYVTSDCECFALDANDVTAINRDFLSNVRAPACQQRCQSWPSPYLVSRCEAGRCQVLNVRQSSITECESSADCMLRVRDCCECGGDAGVDAVIALPTVRFTQYQALVCDDAAPVCDACAPVYPPTQGFGLIARVSCRARHCAVEAVRVEPE